MLTALKHILEGAPASTSEDEVLSFPDYLDLVKNEPWITRNTVQLLHDMLLSSGVERTVVPGKPIKHRYSFFEDEELVAMYVVFGQQKAKANLVEKIDNASRGLETVVDPLGPPPVLPNRARWMGSKRRSTSIRELTKARPIRSFCPPLTNG